MVDRSGEGIALAAILAFHDRGLDIGTNANRETCVSLSGLLDILEFQRGLQFGAIGNRNHPAIADIGSVDLANRIVEAP